MIKKILSDGRVPVKIWTEDVDTATENQLRNLAKMPFIHKHVAVMPDAHLGKGSTVGTVIATRGAIIPAAVGVDIGCGISAVKLPIRAERLMGKDGTLRELRDAIEAVVPVGMNGNKTVTNSSGTYFKSLGDYGAKVKDNRALEQLGSLGGGNHFIEICLDENNDVWVMLHSGSRGIGNLLARHHIEKAQGVMKQYFIDLPDQDLAYFAQGTEEFQAYIFDLLWAQKYAKLNRYEMMTRVLQVMIDKFELPVYMDTLLQDSIDCHHNYTSQENHFGENIWVTRKGAVKATKGTLGIIPGSMGAKSFIVRGKGEIQSFCSCSHGAGRKFSRNKAREVFTVDDFKAQTAGVECRKDEGVLDEIPGAYKDIDEVMANQSDLVEVVHTLKQVLCIKG